MAKPNANETEPKPVKHNLGAKLLIALGLGGFIGGKIGILGLAVDANNLFPKGLSVGEKLKRAASKEIIELLGTNIAHRVQNGSGQFRATLGSMKWSLILSAVSSLVIGAFLWKRTDRIQDSSDVLKHPWKSTKIILGREQPTPETPVEKSEAEVGAYTKAVIERRADQAELNR